MSKAKKITYASLYAALCCIATYFIKVPIAQGYFNIGDIFVLLSGWTLGGIWGGVASGVGSALADLLSGYAVYAPVTFVVKFLMPLIAFYGYTLFKKLIKKFALDFLPRLISAIFAELLMVLGYFVFECIMYGLGGGTAALVGNFIQGGVCLVGGVILATVFTHIPFVAKTFPLLVDKP